VNVLYINAETGDKLPVEFRRVTSPWDVRLTSMEGSPLPLLVVSFSHPCYPSGNPGKYPGSDR